MNTAACFSSISTLVLTAICFHSNKQLLLLHFNLPLAVCGIRCCCHGNDHRRTPRGGLRHMTAKNKKIRHQVTVANKGCHGINGWQHYKESNLTVTAGCKKSDKKKSAEYVLNEVLVAVLRIRLLPAIRKSCGTYTRSQPTPVVEVMATIFNNDSIEEGVPQGS